MAGLLGSYIFWLTIRLLQLVLAVVAFSFTVYGIELCATVKVHDTDVRDIVVQWWHDLYSAPAPMPLSFLLLSSLVTPFAAAYLAIVPAYFGHTSLNQAGLITCIEALMAALWGASSISNAAYLSHRVCFGQVCNLAKAAVVIEFLQW